MNFSIFCFLIGVIAVINVNAVQQRLTCGENEDDDCREESTCADVLWKAKSMPMCSSRTCTCKDGFARHNGRCIGKRECPRESFTCPGNERLEGCGDLCEKRCEDVRKGVVNRPCPRICNPPECVCKEGYARAGVACKEVARC